MAVPEDEIVLLSVRRESAGEESKGQGAEHNWEYRQWVIMALSAIVIGMLSVYKNKPFARFARKARITEADLWKAAQLANQGAIDADLGGGVIKQRIARASEGKSGGSRSIILFRKGDRAIFVYGFEKKDFANIRSNELEAFRELAKVILGYTAAEMERMVEAGVLFRVKAPEGGDND